MKKVLIIDDEECNQIILTYQLVDMSDKVTILRARDRGEAKHLFDTNPDIDLVAMDACVPYPDTPENERYRPNTQALVRYMRSKFEGPIVAVSGSFNSLLTEVGCDHESSKEKFYEIALALLGL
jgi:CheY-like chemotaxis protein